MLGIILSTYFFPSVDAYVFSKNGVKSIVISDHIDFILSAFASIIVILVPAATAEPTKFLLSRPLNVKLIFTPGFAFVNSSAASLNASA